MRCVLVSSWDLHPRQLDRAQGILAALIVTALCILSPAGYAQSAVEDATIEDLGDGRIRVGRIEIDKNTSSFTVPGSVIDVAADAPIEFLAVTRDSSKAYEAALRFDASATSFNLACILIGLEPAGATMPEMHFDPEPVEGPGVLLTLSFERDGEQREVGMRDILAGAEEATDNWVYTGSTFRSDGAYIAEVAGTLVGFVHDTWSIIQHREGIGLGNYGAVVVRSENLPPVDGAVLLRVSRSDAL